MSDQLEEALRQYQTDPNPNSFMAAFYYLLRYKRLPRSANENKDAFHWSAQLLDRKHVSQNLRASAASNLERLNDPNTLLILGRALLDDPNAVVREICADTLGRFDSELKIPYLGAGLLDKDGNVRNACNDSLRKVKSLAVLPYINKALESEKSEKRIIQLKLIKINLTTQELAIDYAAHLHSSAELLESINSQQKILSRIQDFLHND